MYLKSTSELNSVINKNQGTFDFINKITKKKGPLGSHCVKSGGRESGGRESRATDFGAGEVHACPLRRIMKNLFRLRILVYGKTLFRLRSLV